MHWFSEYEPLAAAAAAAQAAAAPAAAPGSRLERQILEPYPRPIELETLEGRDNNLCFNRPDR